MALDKLVVTQDRILGGVTLAPNTTLDLSTVSGLATIELTSNLAATLSNVPDGATVLRIIHNDYTFSLEGKTDWIDNGEGEYEPRIIKYDTGVVRVSDVNGGQGASVPSSLGAFSATGITLSASGYYTPTTIAADTTLTFAATGHVEGVKHHGKFTFDGTDILSVTAPEGININVAGFQSVTPIAAGTYMLYMTVEGGEITVELKAIATIQSIVIMSDTFTGATIDTTTIWDLTNSQSAILEIIQSGDKLRANVKTTATTTAGVDLLSAKVAFDQAGECAIAIDFVENTDLSNFNTYMRLWIDATHYATVQMKDNTGDCLIGVYDGTGYSYILDTNVALWGKRWRIYRNSSNQIIFGYWNVDQWTEFTSAVTLVGTAEIRFNPWVYSGGQTGYMDFDRFQLASTTYATELAA